MTSSTGNVWITKLPIWPFPNFQNGHFHFIFQMFLTIGWGTDDCFPTGKFCRYAAVRVEWQRSHVVYKIEPPIQNKILERGRFCITKSPPFKETF